MLIKHRHPHRRPDSLGDTLAAMAFLFHGSIGATLAAAKADQVQRNGHRGKK